MTLQKSVEVSIEVRIVLNGIADIELDGSTISVVKFDTYTYSADSKMAVFYMNGEAIADVRNVDKVEEKQSERAY